MNKIKIAYCGYDVVSTKHEVEDVEAFANWLVQHVPTLDDAKKYVTAFADIVTEEWVDGYGDDMFWAPRSNPRKVCEQTHLFLHMKGKWHVTDDGCDWEPVDTFFKQAA
jgi:hypothetical protein